MTEKRLETVSALIDDRVDQEHELDAVLADEEAREAFRRYQISSELMRSEQPPLSLDIREGVMAALDNEPAIVAPQKRRKPVPQWARQSAGMAIAASVALVAIFSWQSLMPATDNGTPMAGQQAPQTTTSASTAESLTASSSTGGVNTEEDELQQYLRVHDEQAEPVGDLRPWVRVVNYEE